MEFIFAREIDRIGMILLAIAEFKQVQNVNYIGTSPTLP